MRSSNSKMIGNGVTSNTGTPVENGLPQKEDHGIDEDEVHTVAARVVENVVRLASVAASDANAKSKHNSPKNKRTELKSLPTIQIDTVPSPPSSPTELSPVSVQSNEEPLDASDINIDLEEEQVREIPVPLSDDLKESLKSYIEDILSKAMVVAEKKIKFVGFDDNYEEECLGEEASPFSDPEEKCSGEHDEAEIRAAAEKVVEEVLTKAQESVIEQIEEYEKEIAALDFPITFEEAPEYVKDVASNFVKEIVVKAVAQAEEKAVPPVSFNFEDVDLMKTNGPWYVRVREALVRVLRTACFCTPRRNDS